MMIFFSFIYTHNMVDGPMYVCVCVWTVDR